MQNKRKLPHKSFVSELLTIIKEDDVIFENLGERTTKRASAVKAQLNKDQNSKDSQAISYLLHKKSPASMEVAKKLLFWTNNKPIDKSRNAAA